MKKYFNLYAVIAITVFLFLAAGNVAAQTSPCGATDYDCKIKYNQNQIKADPKNTEAYYNLGLAFQNKGEYAQSVAMFDLYLSIGVNNPEYMADGYYNRGFAQRNLGKNDLAIKDFTKAIGLAPTQALFYSDRGKAYNDLKNFALAVADFNKAIGLKSDHSTSYFGRGFAYMEQKDYVRAAADFTKVIALDPASYEAYYNRGTAYYHLKRYAESITDLNKYIALNQADTRFMADGYNSRGLSYLYSGSAVKAVGDFTKAIELAPAVKNGYVNRALAYRKLNKIVLAEADERKAATLQSK